MRIFWVAIATSCHRAISRKGARLITSPPPCATLPLLCNPFRDYPRPHGAPTLPYREAKLLLHRDWGNQLHLDGDVVPRHHHLHLLPQLHRPRHVGGPKEVLRPIPVEKPHPPASRLLRLHVDLGLPPVGLGD